MTRKLPSGPRPPSLGDWIETVLVVVAVLLVAEWLWRHAEGARP